MTLSITANEYEQFQRSLEKACGIMLSHSKEYLVISRLRHLVDGERIKSLSMLISEMERNRKLKELVVDAMTTNETLWFRDDHPFKIFRSQLLPELAKRKRPLRIWSAACSTGQEPYSLSIAIEEFKRSNPGVLVDGEKIIATDISPTALATAKEGVYLQLALRRGMETERLGQYFQALDNNQWRINDNIKRRVEFRALNLQSSFAGLGKFDLVYCRNVLIYFSSELKCDILTRMHQTLHADGHLFVGASEALNNLSDYYTMKQFSPGIGYQAKAMKVRSVAS